jgi:predicted Zn-dependent peptidase
MTTTTILMTATLLTAPAVLLAQRDVPPAPGTPKNFRLAAPRTFALANGMQVTLTPFGTMPKAHVRLVLRAGALNERPRETWLSGLAADMLVEGTTTKSASQLAEVVASMGGSLFAIAGADETMVGTEVLAERAADAIALVADVVQRPAFPAAEFERVRETRLRQLAIAMTQPQPIALATFRETLYGDHPYGRLYPTEAQLKGYTLDQARGFWARNAGAQRAHLYVAGVFDAAAVERAIRRAFDGWAKGPAPLLKPPAPASRRQLELVDRPKAVQSTIAMGLPVPPPSNRDWIGLSVTNALLGGSFASRITSNIREDKGYTYSPFSQVSPRVQDAYWMQSADVSAEHTGASLQEILREVDRLRTAPPAAEELRGIQNYAAGIFTIQNSSRSGIVSQLQFANLHGLGPGYLTSYVDHVMQVTPEEVQRITRRYVDPTEMTIVVVGDSATVAPQLQPFQAAVP